MKLESKPKGPHFYKVECHQSQEQASSRNLLVIYGISHYFFLGKISQPGMNLAVNPTMVCFFNGVPSFMMNELHRWGIDTAGADHHLHSFLGGKGLGSNKAPTRNECRCCLPKPIDTWSSNWRARGLGFVASMFSNVDERVFEAKKKKRRRRSSHDNEVNLFQVHPLD